MVLVPLALVVLFVIWLLNRPEKPYVRQGGSLIPPTDSYEPEDPYQKRFHEKALRESARPVAPRRNLASSSENADAEFENLIARTVPVKDQWKAFYSNVVGVSHKNEDGTRRAKIIMDCEIFESFDLRHEPDNPYDPNAISVRRWDTGDQLGFIDARLASEIGRDREKHGGRWIAFLRHKNLHLETGRVVGALIYIIRLSDDYVVPGQEQQQGAGIET